MSKKIIFDMDGTITNPYIDFKSLQNKIGATGPIWEHIQTLKGEEYNDALAVLHQFEKDAAHNSSLNDSVFNIFNYIEKQGWQKALLTRNSRLAADIILRRFSLDFDIVVTRDDAPIKPSPEPVKKIINFLGGSRKDYLLVGDYEFDMISGREAGIKTVLLTNGENFNFKEKGDYQIKELEELIQVLDQIFIERK